MARANLVLVLLAITCEDRSVDSFSFAPGGLQNAKPSSILGRPDAIHARGAECRGAAERYSSGYLNAATTAVTESSEYLENKEALKKVGSLPPMMRTETQLVAVTYVRVNCETADVQQQ